MNQTRLLTETQEKIAQSAFSLFAQNGYKSTTTKEIARLAGVNESTLFKNFSSKLEIFETGRQLESSRFQTQLAEIFSAPFISPTLLITEGGRQLYHLFLVYHDYVLISFRELENKELKIGQNTVFEMSSNAMMKELSSFTEKPPTSYGPAIFQLVSSLLFLSLNDRAGGLLTDELVTPISVTDLCQTTASLLTGVEYE